VAPDLGQLFGGGSLALVGFAKTVAAQAEMTGLVWSRLNLTAEPNTADGENLPPYSLAVRQNYYAGEFGSVKSQSRQRIVPIPVVVVEALSTNEDDERFHRAE
jgi:hypothetical protein